MRAGAIARADLVTLRDNLSSQRDNVTDAALERALARETLTALITRRAERCSSTT